MQPVRTALWRADAIHRARNLAQLARSMVSISERRDDGWLSPDAVQEARALSRLYEELGRDDPNASAMPCAPILREIASRLIAMFGHSRAIEVEVDLQPLSIPADVRRALVLICSELVINALKYGVSAERSGKVAVRLTHGGGQVCLAVADNGPGIAGLYVRHEGGALLDRLSTVLGATITRSPGIGGSGYRVSVAFAHGAAGQ